MWHYHFPPSFWQVGQYLRLGDLEQPVDRSKNFWHNFLRENPQVAAIEGIIEPSDKTSLAFEKELLKVVVNFSTGVRMDLPLYIG